MRCGGTQKESRARVGATGRFCKGEACLTPAVNNITTRLAGAKVRIGTIADVLTLLV